MRVSKSALDSYTSTLNGCQAKAAAYVERSISSYIGLNPGATSSDLCEYGAQILLQAVRTYGDQAAVAACEMYNATVRAAGIRADAADILNEYEEYQARARAYSALAESNGDVSRFLGAVRQAAADKTLQAANKTTAAAAARDYGKGVRWARVPTGKETCGFCVMLASRGFKYTSAEAAGDEGGAYNRYHDRCDCRVVAGTEDTVVDGYDPEWYKSVYLDARRTAGFGSTSTHGRGDVNAVCNEINRRNASWVYGGTPGTTTVSAGAKPKLKEATIASMLNEHGFDVEFVKPSNASGVRTADCKVNGRYWEIKQPVGDAISKAIGNNTIDHQFESVVGQSRRLILDATVIETYPGVSGAWLEAEVSSLLYGKWSGSFDEVLVVGSGGLRRFKK